MRAYDPAEVSQLRRFLKEPGAVSRDIIRGWKLCPRHTWAAAVVECELDWRPRVVGALSRELLSRALQVLTAPGWPRRFRRRFLRDRGECVICADLADVGASASTSAHADTDAAERVNAGIRFAAMAERGRGVWAPFTCPPCAGGRGPLCRPHLLELPGGFTSEATTRLRDAYGRLVALTGPVPGTARATPAAEAGLIAALGFIAGWTEAPLEVISTW